MIASLGLRVPGAAWSVGHRAVVHPQQPCNGSHFPGEETEVQRRQVHRATQPGGARSGISQGHLRDTEDTAWRPWALRFQGLATPSALSTLVTLNVQAVSGLDSTQDTGARVPGQQSSIGGGPLLVLWEHLPGQGWPIHPQSRLTTCLASTFLPMVPSLQPQRGPLHPDRLFSTLQPR